MPKTRTTKWPPEAIEAMRKKLRGGATLQEVGDEYGVTRERVRQLAGNVGRSSTWRKEARKREAMSRVIALAKAGLSDEKIAEQAHVSVLTVRRYRYQAKVLRPNPRYRHTVETSILYAKLWFSEYGFTPGVADWSRAHAIKLGHGERVRRLEKFSQKHRKPPSQKRIRELFGSWPEFIRKAELPQVPRGYRAHHRFKAEKD